MKPFDKKAYITCMHNMEYCSNCRDHFYDIKNGHVYHRYLISNIEKANRKFKSIRFYLNKNIYVEITVFETGWLTELDIFP